MDNLVDCLEHWVSTHPDRTIYRFLDGRGKLRENYTYREFYERALGLAQHLSKDAGVAYGDRVLLVYPAGLEMMAAFFACVLVGSIPVPVCAPVSLVAGAGSKRLEHVAADCEAHLALTTSSYLRGHAVTASDTDARDSATPQLATIRWQTTDAYVEPGTRNGHSKTNPILFLQYTSGSTGEPKGVIVTHRNLVHNAHATLQHCPVGVSWLPQYHDMGLIGHYLFMVALGGTNHAFSPFDFLKRPVLWLQTISKAKATITAAPNFAYNYCLRLDKVPDDALCGVDLSSLKMMTSAAEPVNAQTYVRFFERFEKYGLPRESYQTCYGLAENTLSVSSHGRQILTLQKQRLQQRQLCIHKTRVRNNNQLSLVSCGQPLRGMDVRIVEPETRRALGEDAIGEIWIDGESKCAGYWQRPELTQEVFKARIDGESDSHGSYLRTGDLGFFHEGDLFVCGRIKDMIIIHGSNYYPQDIEAIIAAEFPNIGPEGPVQSAAFAIEHDGEERLAVVMEVRQRDLGVDPADVAQVIRSRYFIDPQLVLFVAPRSISKTTSGKVARRETRERWLNGNLPVLASYEHAEDDRSNAEAGLRASFERIQELYHLRGDEEVTLTDVGLDSLTLVDLTLEIQRHFEHRGLAHVVSELDARFLQRLTVAELSQLLEVYEADPDGPTEDLRAWLEARQHMDDAQELERMRADGQWQPPATPAEEARDNPHTVFLTGASGFFGPFLLGSLLQRTSCEFEVLVRAADLGHGRARLIDALQRSLVWTPELEEQFHARVRVVCGDLGLGQLGLTDGEWRRLCNETDAIMHNGARVNYVFSYDALRLYNVEATRELVRMAATVRKKPFHLISTTFVHGWSTSPISAEHDCYYDLHDLDFGYAQSKCVAEHLVRSAESQGYPIRIYRPALISASSRGVGNKDDIFVRLLAFMIKYGLCVDILNQTSLLPADLVSDHIARMFLLKDTPSNTFHITATDVYNIIDVTQSIAEQFGYSFRYLSIDRFIEEMNRLCTPEDPLYPLLVFFNRSHDKFKPLENKRYDNRHYRAALEQVKPEIREPGCSDTVAYIVKYMQREGLISPCEPVGTVAHHAPSVSLGRRSRSVAESA